MVCVQVWSWLAASHQRSHVHVHVAVLGQALHDVVIYLPPATPLSYALALIREQFTALFLSTTLKYHLHISKNLQGSPKNTACKATRLLKLGHANTTALKAEAMQTPKTIVQW